MRRYTLLALCAVLAGCQRSAPPSPAGAGPVGDPSSQAADQGDTLRLHVGETRQVIGGLAVQFRALVSESRCPMNAVCVWQGDAAVRLHLTAAGGQQADTTLHTTLEPRAVQFGGYDIGLVHVEPYPVADQKPDSTAYVVTLTATQP